MIVTLAWTVMMLENEHLVQNSFPQALQFWDQKVKCTNLSGKIWVAADRQRRRNNSTFVGTPRARRSPQAHSDTCGRK